MKLSECVPQRLSKMMVGVILLVGALGLIVTGFTLLPVIGLVLAVPVIVLGVYFIKIHLNEKCEIDPL
ncbi:MAG: hypothetical protein R6V41_12785 [Desulfobacteraceae bacterium]